MEIPNNHLSFSSVSCFLRCPRQFYYRYVEGSKVPPAGAMLRGRAFHESVEHNYNAKIATGADVPVEDARGVAAAAFDRMADSSEAVWSDDEPRGKALDNAVACAVEHRTEIAPSVMPALVEQKWSIDLWGDGYTLVGVWDVVDQQEVIGDSKSWSKPPSAADVDKDLQLTAYSTAYRALTGRHEGGLRLDGVVLPRQGKTKLRPAEAKRFSTVRTEAENAWFKDLVANVAKGIRAESFPPNPTGWHCSRERCGWWSRCAGKRT